MTDIRDILESGKVTDVMVNGSSESLINYDDKATRSETALDLECRVYSADQLTKAEHQLIKNNDEEVNVWKVNLGGVETDTLRLLQVTNL